MNIGFRAIKRLAFASALASGLISTVDAASAQTTTAVPSANATTLSMSTVNAKAARQAALAREHADSRRVEFRNLGTSL